jgi:hypothetical protein
MESEEFENFFFATQSHVMTDDLLNALDECVWPMVPSDVAIDYKKGKLVNEPSNEIYIWFMEFMRAVNIDDEFEVSAAQAKWLVQMAQKYESEEPQESNDSVLLVIDTFDDFANFQRIGNSEADSKDLFRVAIKKSKK